MSGRGNIKPLSKKEQRAQKKVVPVNEVAVIQEEVVQNNVNKEENNDAVESDNKEYAEKSYEHTVKVFNELKTCQEKWIQANKDRLSKIKNKELTIEDKNTTFEDMYAFLKEFFENKDFINNYVKWNELLIDLQRAYFNNPNATDAEKKINDEIKKVQEGISAAKNKFLQSFLDNPYAKLYKTRSDFVDLVNKEAKIIPLREKGFYNTKVEFGTDSYINSFMHSYKKGEWINIDKLKKDEKLERVSVDADEFQNVLKVIINKKYLDQIKEDEKASDVLYELHNYTTDSKARKLIDSYIVELKGEVVYENTFLFQELDNLLEWKGKLTSGKAFKDIKLIQEINKKIYNPEYIKNIEKSFLEGKNFITGKDFVNELDREQFEKKVAFMFESCFIEAIIKDNQRLVQDFLKFNKLLNVTRFNFLVGHVSELLEETSSLGEVKKIDIEILKVLNAKALAFKNSYALKKMEDILMFQKNTVQKDDNNAIEHIEQLLTKNKKEMETLKMKEGIEEKFNLLEKANIYKYNAFVVDYATKQKDELKSELLKQIPPETAESKYGKPHDAQMEITRLYKELMADENVDFKDDLKVWQDSWYAKQDSWDDVKDENKNLTKDERIAKVENATKVIDELNAKLKPKAEVIAPVKKEEAEELRLAEVKKAEEAKTPEEKLKSANEKLIKDIENLTEQNQTALDTQKNNMQATIDQQNLTIQGLQDQLQKQVPNQPGANQDLVEENQRLSKIEELFTRTKEYFIGKGDENSTMIQFNIAKEHFINHHNVSKEQFTARQGLLNAALRLDKQNTIGWIDWLKSPFTIVDVYKNYNDAKILIATQDYVAARLSNDLTKFINIVKEGKPYKSVTNDENINKYFEKVKENIIALQKDTKTSVNDIKDIIIGRNDYTDLLSTTTDEFIDRKSPYMTKEDIGFVESLKVNTLTHLASFFKKDTTNYPKYYKAKEAEDKANATKADEDKKAKDAKAAAPKDKTAAETKKPAVQDPNTKVAGSWAEFIRTGVDSVIAAPRAVANVYLDSGRIAADLLCNAPSTFVNKVSSLVNASKGKTK